MEDFNSFRKSRQDNVSKLMEQMEKAATRFPKRERDPRIWSPTINSKTGEGAALLRLLPESPGATLPWVKAENHSARIGGRWAFIEDCPKTIGKPCPICEAASAYYNEYPKEHSQYKANAAIGKLFLSKLSFYVNVIVIEDPACPENNGQLKIWRFGTKIFEKILASQKPKFQDQKPIDVFDFWSGANFALIVTSQKVGDNETIPNYDTSAFAAPSALYGGDAAKLETLWKSQYNLAEFVDPTRYKSYDELKTVLQSALLAPATGGGLIMKSPEVQPTMAQAADQAIGREPAPKMATVDKFAAAMAAAAVTPSAAAVNTAMADDDISFFQSLNKAKA